MTLGPAGLAVLLARLTGIADEMGAVLRRAAFSPNIKERADCSAALFTADGDLLAADRLIARIQIEHGEALLRAASEVLELEQGLSG